MNEIQVGERVRFLANSYVDGYQYEPTDESKNLKYLTAEDLRDQFGTVIEARVPPMTDDVKVQLNDGRKVITKKQYLRKVFAAYHRDATN